MQSNPCDFRSDFSLVALPPRDKAEGLGGKTSPEQARLVADQVALTGKGAAEKKVPGRREMLQALQESGAAAPAQAEGGNPLLDLSGLPRFDLIQPAHVQPAVTSLLADARAAIERLTDPSVPATWKDFAGPLGACLEPLERGWGLVSHLQAVNGTPAMRQAYNAALPDVTRMFTELGMNQGLFDKFKALRESPEYETLTVAQKKIVDNQVRDFKLSGAELDEATRARLGAVQEELSGLGARFGQNLQDATNSHFEIVTHEGDLAGIPENARRAARAAAEAAGIDGWKFTLQAPSYSAVMQYSENRGLRERMYRASGTLASEFGKPELDNGPVMQRILELRAEEAVMLGFPSYAGVSLATKMARNPEQVLGFLRELAAKARPFAERDLSELREFAQKELGMATVEPWDVGYVSDKLRQARYSYSGQEVQKYYTEPKVLGGLFHVIEKLYGVTIKPEDAPTWNPDVKFFRLEQDGELIGQVYMDLYARDTKRSGAWMGQARPRQRNGDEVQTPLVYINTNFAPPSKDKTATFTPDDVRTLFHETGHALQGLLTKVDEAGVAGTSGVEWDAVELPSQFMQVFPWEPAVAKELTAHVDTGEPIPDELFDKMLTARNFQSGMVFLKQIEMAMFDMRVHSDFDPKGEKSIMQLLDEVRNEVAVTRPPEWHRFPNAFRHIFSGAYSAGYYSYKWAEVMSADAFGAFEEQGNWADPATADRFRKEILEVGGSRPSMESFVRFRGREPQVDALLRQSGLVGDPQQKPPA